jgi:hypothetical protein
MTVARNNSRIDRACSAAICAEMGERLRLILARTTQRMPQRMINLIKRMATDRPVALRPATKPEVTP